MELKEIYKLLKQNWVLLIFFAILGTIFTYFSSFGLPKGTRVESTFFISAANSGTTQDDKIESFYTQEKAINFTDTAVALIESDDFLKKDSTESQFSAEKIAPQIIKVAVFGKDQNTSSQILSQFPQEFNEQILKLEGLQNPIILKKIGNDQSFQKYGPNKSVFAALGAILGITFAIMIIGLKTYLKL